MPAAAAVTLTGSLSVAGAATDLGQASYGGNIHLISRETRDEFFGELQGVYGSYNTAQIRGTINSEIWRELNKLYWKLCDADFIRRSRESPYDLYQTVEAGSALFQGLCDAIQRKRSTLRRLVSTVGSWPAMRSASTCAEPQDRAQPLDPCPRLSQMPAAPLAPTTGGPSGSIGLAPFQCCALW